MGKHMGRLSLRLLPVIMAVILVSGLSAGVSQAAPASGRAASRTEDTTAASKLAPCTKPLFGPDKDCTSTSPTVDRWVQFTGTAVESCTYKMFVDWGDGGKSSNTFVDPTPGQVHFIASHIYNTQTEASYTETVTSAVTSGTCNPIATTVFKFTHLLSAVAPSLTGIQLTNKCKAEAKLELISLGVGGAELLGLFRIPGAVGKVVGLLILAGSTYLVLKFIYSKCVAGSPTSSTTSSTTSLPPLPKAFAYGAKHPGKRFKPSGTVLPRPQITAIYGYQKGTLVYYSLTYANPDHDAKGFGFVGINGAGWAEENHPFSNPSFGIVGKDRIDYPFNLACGTAQQYNSWVGAWIYNSQGLRSNPVEVRLLCTT